ncbi:hypothetical protein GBAR_LOCUS17482 [Geodia barretti]|uniref:Sushi domain-containing protein n=1 Tax=Geodia barretti TaxID=519541 RepID=A0AA35SKS9_GEOBA|nr:hypothetical protein GBAR_LOCUS17482 [Geodia barretti]
MWLDRNHYTTSLFFNCLILLCLCSSIQGFSLSSSPSSEDGIISVCPATTVTLTCTATGVGSLIWRDQNGQIDLFVASDPESMVIEEGPYTLTLVSVDNDDGDSFADFTSTLEVAVDDVANRTNISCIVFRNQTHLVIYKIRAPYPPPNVMVKTENFQPDNFFIIISWESGEDEVVDEYRTLTNTTTQSITTTNTTVVLEGVYNIPLEIRVTAINCAGTSAEVTEEVFVAGCGPPSQPVNGSVGELTSSRVGAQVTYSCDTHLVLVGETVATCSLPSLTWLPSSDDVICAQPPVVSNSSSIVTNKTPVVTVTPTKQPMNGDKRGSSLTTAEAVVTTGVVCVVCSFTAGLLLGVLLTQCRGHCHRKGRRGRTEMPPVYEDIPLEKTPPIELNTNEAYGHISH